MKIMYYLFYILNRKFVPLIWDDQYSFCIYWKYMVYLKFLLYLNVQNWIQHYLLLIELKQIMNVYLQLEIMYDSIKKIFCI